MDKTKKDDGYTTIYMIGGVCGCLGFFIVICIAVCTYRKCKNKNQQPNNYSPA